MKLIFLIDIYAKKLGTLLPEWLLLLASRVAVFMIFWTSAQNKLGGSTIMGQKWMFWDVNHSTLMLFEYEYALPFIPAKTAAYITTWAEFFLSLLLLLGLFTRVSALSLIIITLVIQVFVYPGAWASHLLWAVALIYLLKNGSGAIALENIRRT